MHFALESTSTPAWAEPESETSMKRRAFLSAAIAVGGIATFGPASTASASGARTSLSSVRVNGDDTATFPLRVGRTTDGRRVEFVIIDASDSSAASRYGVNVAQKLANARGTGAVMSVSIQNGTFVFPASVNFGPKREVIGTPGTGFPPVRFSAGSVGETGYTPLVQLPDGTVLNAPQIGNSTGRHDKVVRIGSTTVDLQLTHGFSRTNRVLYLSTDATIELAAALEGATVAPALAAAPKAGQDGTDQARASLAAFINGPTGGPGRQGLNSALLGEGDPLNVLAWTPNQGRYSPLWDVFLTEWAPGTNPRQITQFADVEDLARDRAVTAPGGAPWGPAGVIVNCPIIAEL
jgi:hypothetical protein